MHQEHDTNHDHAEHHVNRRVYLQLLAMAVLSFIAMYILMYSMVNSADNIEHNLNQVYMASLMAAPMVLIELALMRGMYRDLRLTSVAVAISVMVFVGSFVAIRQQAVIGDEQFLRSMIPHHAGAILMCEESSISNDQIEDLCARIIESQRSEIEEMRGLLNNLGD